MPDADVKTVLRIDRQVHGGRGLARLDDGRVALITGGIPGELVEARLESRKGVLLGHVTEVLEASPDRVAAPRHPGLDLGHASYPRQLELKREVLEDALARATGVQMPVPALVPAPTPWGYRSVVQPAVAKGNLGYRVAGSNEHVAMVEDPTANDGVNAAWRSLSGLGLGGGAAAIRELSIRANDEGESLVAFIGSGQEAAALDLAHRALARGITGVAWAPFDPRGRFRGGSRKLTGRRTILQHYGEHEFSVTATSFAQPNPAAASALYRELVSWAGSGDHAVELFAGGGTIAMHLAARFGSVTAIEVDKGAVERGKRDAERLGIGNVELLRTDARRLSLEAGPELFVVDPPRAGLAAELRSELAEAVTGRLLYVSCDVATWARDVADLERRGLRLVRFAPYDFYPQTHHIEVLSLLERSA